MHSCIVVVLEATTRRFHLYILLSDVMDWIWVN